MTDTSTTPEVAPPAAEANGQLIVALAIVVGLVIVAVLLAWQGKNDTAVGAIIGALATALNAPTGIGNVLRATVAKAGGGAAQ